MNLNDINLGGAIVTWNGNDIGTLSEDGIDVAVNSNVVSVGSAQYGATPIKAFKGGDTVEVTLTMRELNKNLLSTLFFNEDTLTDATDGSVGSLGLGNTAGAVMPSGELIVHPLFDVNGAPAPADGTNPYRIKIHKAYCTSDTSIMFSPSEQSSMELTFTALVDDTQPEGQKVLTWGAEGI